MSSTQKVIVMMERCHFGFALKSMRTLQGNQQRISSRNLRGRPHIFPFHNVNTINSVKASSLLSSSWKESYIRSQGDYVQDESKFDSNNHKGILYQHQSTLPSLPLPSLEETLEK